MKRCSGKGNGENRLKLGERLSTKWVVNEQQGPMVTRHLATPRDCGVSTGLPDSTLLRSDQEIVTVAGIY